MKLDKLSAITLACACTLPNIVLAEDKHPGPEFAALVKKVEDINAAKKMTGQSTPISDTKLFKQEKNLHEVIEKSFQNKDWPLYTKACLDLALLERDLPREGLNAVHGYTFQKKYDEAEYLLDKISVGSSPSNTRFYSIEKAKILEAAGKTADAEDLLKNLSLGGGIKDRAAQKEYEFFLCRQGRAAEAETLVAAENDRHCPICGSEKDVVPVGYGLVGDIKADPSTEKVHPAGCMKTDASPKFWCNRDKVSF
jgi:hypothetical protein